MARTSIPISNLNILLRHQAPPGTLAIYIDYYLELLFKILLIILIILMTFKLNWGSLTQFYKEFKATDIKPIWPNLQNMVNIQFLRSTFYPSTKTSVTGHLLLAKKCLPRKQNKQKQKKSHTTIASIA